MLGDVIECLDAVERVVLGMGLVQAPAALCAGGTTPQAIKRVTFLA